MTPSMRVAYAEIIIFLIYGFAPTVCFVAEVKNINTWWVVASFVIALPTLLIAERVRETTLKGS